MAFPEKIEQLTEKQRECLRLVMMHRSSKDIARELGIGVDAVDQRIKGAMKKLGVQSRVEAARMLASTEGHAFGLNARNGGEADRAPRYAPVLRLVRALLPKSRRMRFIFWACIVSLFFGLVEAVSPFDDVLRDWNMAYHRNAASGDIVYVAIDERSAKELGSVPWPRRRIAEMVDRLNVMGANRVALNIPLNRRTDAQADGALAASLARLEHRLALAIDKEVDPDTGEKKPVLPLPEFTERAYLAHPVVIVRLWTVRRVPFHIRIGGRLYPTLASELAAIYDSPADMSWAGKFAAGLRNDNSFPIDYSIDARTIPILSAADLLRGNVSPAQVAGKSILIGSTSPDVLGERVPGQQRLPQDYFHLLAAETLRAGPPIEVAWPIALIPAILVVILCGLARKRLLSIVAISGMLAALLALPHLLDPYMIFVHVSPALFLLALVGLAFSWTALRKRGEHVGTS